VASEIMYGSYDVGVVLGNLRGLTELASRNKSIIVKAYTVVCRQNKSLLPEIEKTIRGCGATEWYTKKMGFYMSAIMDEEDKRNILDIVPEKDNGRMVYDGRLFLSKKKNCGSYIIPIISPEGDVSICCHDMLYRNIVGNILETNSLVWILESEKYKRDAKLGRRRLLPICRGCN